MADWVTATATTVQAVSTVVLVGLTGWYACWVRRQVKQDREFFDSKTAETKELVERQSAEYRERDRQQIDRAIQTIIAELRIDLQDGAWDFQTTPPLLDAAYAANLWAVQLIGMAPDTFRALGNAYLCIQRYNLLFEAATEGERVQAYKRNAAQAAWIGAQTAIRTAIEALSRDPAGSRFF